MYFCPIWTDHLVYDLVVRLRSGSALIIKHLPFELNPESAIGSSVPHSYSLEGPVPTNKVAGSIGSSEAEPVVPSSQTNIDMEDVENDSGAESVSLFDIGKQGDLQRKSKFFWMRLLASQ